MDTTHTDREPAGDTPGAQLHALSDVDLAAALSAAADVCWTRARDRAWALGSDTYESAVTADNEASARQQSLLRELMRRAHAR